MKPSFDNIRSRAAAYSEQYGLTLLGMLGQGKDGSVFAASSATGSRAIKVFARPDLFEQELACYVRLKSHSVTSVLEHEVPLLLRDDRNLSIIEMSIVSRPFVLDFASARLDIPPDFPEDVMRDWTEEKVEQFGPHWPKARAILSFLQSRYGVYLVDVHPGNIGFLDS